MTVANRPRSVLLDTCAVIFLANKHPIASRALDLITRAGLSEGIFVSPVSAWEIGLLSRSGRRSTIQFLPDPKTWFARVLAAPGIRPAPFTPDIAIDSSHLPEPVHGDPADRMLIATARHLGASIVTSDRLILAYGVAGHVSTIAC